MQTFVIALLPLAASAFVPSLCEKHHLVCTIHKKRTRGPASFLAASPSPNNNQNQADDNSSSEGGTTGNDGKSNPSNKKYTAGRAGGRRPRNNSKPQHDATKDTKSGNDLFSVIRRWVLPLCLLTVILRFLTGMLFGGANPNGVYYYSSSVSQSTTYRDGNVETTTRKESFQSNIPGLVGSARENKRDQQEIFSNEDEYYFDSVDEEVSDYEEEIFDSLFPKW